MNWDLKKQFLINCIEVIKGDITEIMNYLLVSRPCKIRTKYNAEIIR